GRPILVGSVLLITVAGSIWYALPHRASDQRPTTWVPITTEFPELENVADVSALSKVEVSKGAAVTGGKALLDGAISTYTESVEFYGKLADDVENVDGIRTPTGDETTALVVTD